MDIKLQLEIRIPYLPSCKIIARKIYIFKICDDMNVKISYTAVSPSIKIYRIRSIRPPFYFPVRIYIYNYYG